MSGRLESGQGRKPTGTWKRQLSPSTSTRDSRKDGTSVLNTPRLKTLYVGDLSVVSGAYGLTHTPTRDRSDRFVVEVEGSDGTGLVEAEEGTDGVGGSGDRSFDRRDGQGVSGTPTPVSSRFSRTRTGSSRRRGGSPRGQEHPTLDVGTSAGPTPSHQSRFTSRLWDG